MSYLEEIVDEVRVIEAESADPLVKRLANAVAVLCDQLERRGAGGTEALLPKRVYSETKIRNYGGERLFKKP